MLSTQTSRKLSGITATLPAKEAALVTAFVALVYHAITYFNTMNPELATWWVSYRFTTWKAMFEPYLRLGVVFYRPTIFYVLLPSIGSVLDWHNVAGYRYLSFILMSADCLAIYILVRIIWNGSTIAAVAAAAYFAANPANYIVVTENFFSDTVSVLFLLGTVIVFHAALMAESRQRRNWLVTASILMFLLDLTSRENGFFLSVFLFLVAWRFMRYQLSSGLAALRSAVSAAAPFILLSALFACARLVLLKHLSNTGFYRTEANWGIMAQNAARMFLWMVHIFKIPLRDYIDIHNTALETSVGAVLLFLTLSGWLLLFRRNRRETIWDFVECIVWILLFMSLAVFGGYAPWHIFTALVGYSVFVGLGVAEVLDLIPSERGRAVTALIALGCFGLLAQSFYSKQANHPNRSVFYRLNYNAIRNPPALKNGGAGNALIFYEDSISLNDWAFGGNNNLFKFVYDNPGLQERRIVNVDSVSAQDCLSWLSNDKAYYLRYTQEYDWYDDSSTFSHTCLSKVVRAADQLLAAHKPAEATALLKPIAERYPEDGMHIYQYALSLEYLGRKQEAAVYYRRAVNGMPVRFWAEFGDGRVREGAPLWTLACVNRGSGEGDMDGLAAQAATACNTKRASTN
jgi:hypothetical protein